MRRASSTSSALRSSDGHPRRLRQLFQLLGVELGGPYQIQALPTCEGELGVDVSPQPQLGPLVPQRPLELGHTDRQRGGLLLQCLAERPKILPGQPMEVTDSGR